MKVLVGPPSVKGKELTQDLVNQNYDFFEELVYNINNNNNAQLDTKFHDYYQKVIELFNKANKEKKKNTNIKIPLGSKRGENLSPRIINSNAVEYTKIEKNLETMKENHPEMYSKYENFHIKLKELIHELKDEINITLKKEKEISDSKSKREKEFEEKTLKNSVPPNLVKKYKGTIIPKFFQGRFGVNLQGKDLTDLSFKQIKHVVTLSSPRDVNRYGDIIEKAKNLLSDWGKIDGVLAYDSSKNITPPKEVFFGHHNEIVKKFADTPIDELEDWELAEVHRHINYNVKGQREVIWQIVKPFYDRITKILLEKGSIQLSSKKEILYKNQINLLNKFPNSQYIGTLGERELFTLVQLKKDNYSRPKEKVGSDGIIKFYYLLRFTDVETKQNVVEIFIESSPSNNNEKLLLDIWKETKTGSILVIDATVGKHIEVGDVKKTFLNNPVFHEKLTPNEYYNYEKENKYNKEINKDSEISDAFKKALNKINIKNDLNTIELIKLFPEIKKSEIAFETLKNNLPDDIDVEEFDNLKDDKSITDFIKNIGVEIGNAKHNKQKLPKHNFSGDEKMSASKSSVADENDAEFRNILKRSRLVSPQKISKMSSDEVLKTIVDYINKEQTKNTISNIIGKDKFEILNRKLRDFTNSELEKNKLNEHIQKILYKANYKIL